MTENQADIINGVFFGQAIGDALGLGTEFLNNAEVKSFYPNGLSIYSEIIQDKHRSRWKIGDWTDDTDQFLCIIDAILESGSINEISFAKELFKWFKGVPMGIGYTTLKVLNMPEYRSYPHKGAEYVWKFSKCNSASNGAIMRTSALGIWEFWDNEKVIDNTERVCKATHFDPRCVGSCVIITSIISAILRENRFLNFDELVVIGDKYDNRIKEYIYLAQSKDISVLKLDEINSIGYTLKALSAGLWAYFNASSFEDGLLKVVNEGGDADTNAAVACSLLGTKYGFKSIPKIYIDQLLNKKYLFEKVIDFKVEILKNYH